MRVRRNPRNAGARFSSKLFQLLQKLKKKKADPTFSRFLHAHVTCPSQPDVCSVFHVVGWAGNSSFQLITVLELELSQLRITIMSFNNFSSPLLKVTNFLGCQPLTTSAGNIQYSIVPIRIATFALVTVFSPFHFKWKNKLTFIQKPLKSGRFLMSACCLT